MKLNRKKPEPNSRADPAGGSWRVVRLRDERTGKLWLKFTFPIDDKTSGTHEVPNEFSLREIVRKLRGHTTCLKPGKQGEKFINALLAKVPPQMLISASQPGWRASSEGTGRVFITPYQSIGRGSYRYVWGGRVDEKAGLGRSCGTLDGWRNSIGALAEHSSYVAFAIMASLAAPLLPSASLTENPAFNFFGRSSGGKTGALMAGAAVMGNPKGIRDWNFRERGMEEEAADRNHMLIVLNAAEKMSPRRLGESLTHIVHVVVEGTSAYRSVVVHDQLPPLSWTAIILSSSNRSGADIAAQAGLAWDEQEQARFIDIPVPLPVEGGIFDCIGTSGNDRGQESTRLIGELERALEKQYGTLLRPWIVSLLQQDATGDVQELMRKFLKKVGNPTGLEDRIARKFALVYAAGWMAVDNDLLDWPKSLPRDVVLKLYKRAKQARFNPSDDVSAALQKLNSALDDRQFVKEVKIGEQVMVPHGLRLLGVRYAQAGRDRVGLRQEELSALVGPDTFKPLLRLLGREKVLLSGHGDKAAQQVPIALQFGSSVVKKPRLLVFDEKRLRRLCKQFT